MDNISEKQYENLRKNFNNMTNMILGDGYYNIGGDVYSTDTIAAGDIIYAYEQMKKERDHYRLMSAGLSMVFVLGIVFVQVPIQSELL